MFQKEREALQSRPKIRKGARSATERFFLFLFFLWTGSCRIDFFSAQNLGELHTDHWLCNRQDVQLPLQTSLQA